MNHRFYMVILMAAILAGALSVGTAGAAPTTQPATGQGRLQRFKEALAQLDLTSGQTAKIKSIMTDAKAKLEGLKSGTAPATADKTQAREIVRSTLEKIMGVLSPAQKTKLKEILKADRGSTTQPGT